MCALRDACEARGGPPHLTVENHVVVAYQGEAGAYSEEGTRALFPDAEHRPFPSIRAVFEAVEVGLVSFGVPLAGPDDRPPLAINISLPTMRATPPEREALIARLRETADVITASLRLAA